MITFPVKNNNYVEYEYVVQVFHMAIILNTTYLMSNFPPTSVGLPLISSTGSCREQIADIAACPPSVERVLEQILLIHIDLNKLNQRVNPPTLGTVFRT